MNGHSLEQVRAPLHLPARSVTPSSHLGKRKRSQSPDKPLSNGDVAHKTDISLDGTDTNVDNILREIKEMNVSPRILEYTIPKPLADGHSIKKQKIEEEKDSVEARIANGYYSSVDPLLKDLQLVLYELKKTSSEVNGLPHDAADTLSSSDLAALERLLSQYSHSPGSSVRRDNEQAPAFTDQIITLRSNDAGIVKQLFTGSRKSPAEGVKIEDIDIRKLPAGFDVVDAVASDPPQFTESEPRTFGDVFRPSRNLRPLEPPKSSRGTRDTQLTFVKPFENYGISNKEDYRLAALSAGSWLEYAGPDPELGKFSQHRPIPDRKDSISLFKATFSSFAPSQDTSAAVVPHSHRSRQWFGKYGDQAIRLISADSGSREWSTHEYPEIDDNYQQLIDEFIPEPEEESKAIPSTEDDADEDVLNEISELLSTLSSYQRLRDLDRNRVFSANGKPAAPEVEVYDLLRQQLKILVSTLPPFAVAKLDGDQLEALNVSPNILITTSDIAGTGQPDDGSLHRARQLQAQQQPQSRPPQPRNSYTATTPTVNYGTQSRSYSSNIPTTPSMPGYAQRGTQLYNTPRPGVAGNNAAYGQTPYQQRPQQPFPGATIQQFQRIQNGYSQNNQTPYQPRASQNSYQSQTQNNSVQQYGRPNSPAKALTNGTPQPQPSQASRNSYSTPSSTSLLQGPYAQANAHATIQQVKAAHQMQQQQAHQSHSQSPQPQPMQGTSQQRQASSTPQPHTQPQPLSQSTATTTVVEGAVNGTTSHGSRVQSVTATPTPVASTSA